MTFRVLVFFTPSVHKLVGTLDYLFFFFFLAVIVILKESRKSRHISKSKGWVKLLQCIWFDCTNLYFTENLSVVQGKT